MTRQRLQLGGPNETPKAVHQSLWLVPEPPQAHLPAFRQCCSIGPHITNRVGCLSFWSQGLLLTWKIEGHSRFDELTLIQQ